MQLLRKHQAIWRTLTLCMCMYFLMTLQSYGADETKSGQAQDVLVIVKGVTNPFTQFGLIKHLEQIPGVKHVTFNLLHGLAEIRLKPGAQVTAAEIRQAIRSASYTPGTITWPTTGPQVGNEAELGSGH